MSDEGDAPQITFNIKASNDQKHVVTVPETMTVLELKEKLSTTEYADIPAERQRLIYSGRVLKDPDALSVYKIKDGNTVHMVKGAASNARQNPASSSSGSVPPGAGVPQNLATGTAANDPAAQLTGARYAGFAQMPGADMFGPDGGMGPPPDSSDMLQMLENPMIQSQMNEAMNNPAVIQMLQNNPMIRNNPMMRQMLENPEMRRMMMDPAILRQSIAMRNMFGGGGNNNSGGMPAPGVTSTTPQSNTGSNNNTTANTTGTTPNTQQQPFGGNPFAMFGGGGGAAGNPFAALLGNPPANTNTGSTGTTEGNTNQAQNPSQQQNPFAGLFGGGMPNFDPQMMQNMMNSFGMGGMGMGGQQEAAPQDTRPPEEVYESQLRQLNEMGFHEFNRNVRALRRAGGNVQGAIEYLFSGDE